MTRVILLTSVCLLVLAGCRGNLDTGYQPKKLGVTTEERRGYYSPAFTPEAVARDAAIERDKP